MLNIVLAFRCFFRVLLGKEVPAEARGEKTGETPAALPAASPSPTVQASEIEKGAALLLALLQREGRLIDFLQEPIDAYDDAQIGAAVRNIHRDCRKALSEHCQLKPILDGTEDSPVVVEQGFDPGEVRLVGNVTGEPPFRGLLRHHGWKIDHFELPATTGAADPRLVTPAEVELSAVG